MNDRELLELAAKAAGFEWRYEDDGRMSVFMCDRRWVFWNPMTDDGDAFRLSVHLNFEIERSKLADRAYVGCPDDAPWVEYTSVGVDLFEATRLAIVRAAAAIGAAL